MFMTMGFNRKKYLIVDMTDDIISEFKDKAKSKIAPKIVKTRKRFKMPISIKNKLEIYFKREKKPSIFQRVELSKEYRVPEKNISVWFQNRRTREKNLDIHNEIDDLKNNLRPVNYGPRYNITDFSINNFNYKEKHNSYKSFQIINRLNRQSNYHKVTREMNYKNYLKIYNQNQTLYNHNNPDSRKLSQDTIFWQQNIQNYDTKKEKNSAHQHLTNNDNYDNFDQNFSGNIIVPESEPQDYYVEEFSFEEECDSKEL